MGGMLYVMNFDCLVWSRGQAKGLGCRDQTVGRNILHIMPYIDINIVKV